MGVILDLIIDRTLADVTQFRTVRNKIYAQGWAALSDAEKAGWLNSKGEYRHTDLNRVGAAVAYLSSLLRSFGYPVCVTPKLDWTRNDIPSSDQLAVYLTGVAAIKSAFYATVTLPSTMDYLTYAAANSIELLLFEVESSISAMAEAFDYAGEFYAVEAS